MTVKAVSVGKVNKWLMGGLLRRVIDIDLAGDHASSSSRELDTKGVTPPKISASSGDGNLAASYLRFV
jgi:hypothetical protein